MVDTWVEILVYPGFLFTIGVALLYEQIGSRIYSKFDFREKSRPFFIPIFYHFKLCFRGEQEKITLASILQGIILVVMLAIGLTAAMVLPIMVEGTLPVPIRDYGTFNPVSNGVIGIITFEGDLLLLITLLLFYGIMVFLVYFFSPKYSNSESISIGLRFLLFDLLLIFSSAGPVIVRRSLSISVLAEDIRVITYFNQVFGFLILIPLGLTASLLALTFKFDQAFFDKIKNPKIGITAPFPLNWKMHLFDLANRVMEFVIAGIIVSVFLGGAYYPIPIYTLHYSLAYVFNFLFKTGLVILLTTAIRIFTPRMKNSQAIKLVLQILLPIVLIYLILIVGYEAIWGIN